MPRLHILGASGCGTTTLGRALCVRHGWVHVDTDDVFWLPSDPPYLDIRPREERVALMRGQLDAASDWIVSGSMCRWGDVFIPRFGPVVFLTVPSNGWRRCPVLCCDWTGRGRWGVGRRGRESAPGRYVKPITLYEGAAATARVRA